LLLITVNLYLFIKKVRKFLIMKYHILILLLIVLTSMTRSQLKFVDEDSEENKFLVKKKIDDILKWVNRLFHEDKLESKIDKDVIDYVMSLKRQDLIEVAYSLERYHRIIFNQTGLMGGLHDYVFRISDDLIRNFIFKELNEHPEICEKSHLVKLVNLTESQTEELKKYKRDFIIGDGIHDYLATLDRPIMNRIALALENYHRKQKDEFMFGGLHDYIDQISEEDLRSYIIKEANEHSEINSVSAIKDLIK
jgi:hypothetical protein